MKIENCQSNKNRYVEKLSNYNKIKVIKFYFISKIRQIENKAIH